MLELGWVEISTEDPLILGLKRVGPCCKAERLSPEFPTSRLQQARQQSTTTTNPPKPPVPTNTIDENCNIPGMLQ